MAQNKPWCFNLESPISTLPEFIDSYKQKLEEYHSKVSLDEWKEIVSDLDLDTYEFLRQFEEKPDFATQGPWWDLAEDVDVSIIRGAAEAAGGISAVTAEINPWREEKEFLSLAGNANVEINRQLVSFVTYFPTQWAQEIGQQGKTLNDDDRENRDIIKNSLNELKNRISSGEITYDQLNEIRDTIKIAGNDLADNNSNVESFWQFFGNLEQAITTLQFQLEQISKCRDESHFEEAYTRAILALALAKIASESQKNAIKGDANKILGLIPGVDPFELEDLDELRKKIESKIRQEVAEAFADNLIFSEQCFMLSKLLEFVTYKKSKPLSFPLPYKSGVNNPDLCGSSKAVNANLRNQPILMQGESFSFMNKLAVEPSQRVLFNDILPHEISSITPNIELFKVVTETSNDELIEYEVPIKFTVNTPAPRVNEIYKPQRGTGVGLKSFKFSYDGTDPFSAKKAISANLSIFASSMTDLLRPNETGLGDITYRYTDLALKTGTTNKDATLTDQERENIDKLNFRLKVVVQWAAAKELLRGIGREEIRNALYNSAITLYLTPVIHTFDFDDTGAVTFNISYQAYIEDFFTNDNFDIFADLIGVREGRRYVLDFFKDQSCDLLAGEEFKNFQKFDSAFIIQNNKKALNSIVNNLHQRNLINYLNMTYSEIEEWMSNPAAFVGKAIEFSDSVASAKPNNIAAEAIDKAIATQDSDGNVDFGDLRLSLVANSQENQNIAFVYLSDLISVVMNMIEEQLLILDKKGIFYDKYADATRNLLQTLPKLKGDLNSYITKKYQEDVKKKRFANTKAFKNMRIVLGPINLSSNTNTKMNNLSCSIGDIPISLNYLIDFLSGKVIAKDLSHYPISKFIKDVVNELIRNFINSEDCAGSNTSQRISINSTTVVGYDQEIFKEDFEYLDNINYLANQPGSSNFFKKGVFLLDQIPEYYFPLLKISADRDNPNTSKGIEFMTNYYIFSAGRSYPSDKYIGKESIDSQSGIFHYVLGRDRGIVKNIKLQKTNTPGLKEVRFEQEGYAGLEQLREVYNASIDCYLNVQTFPGTYIYIVPEGFAPDMGLEILTDDNEKRIDLTKFGIGGYYMITKTEHEISPGTGNTSIEATWVASKDGTYGKKQKVETRGDGEGSEKVKKCIVAGSSRGR